MTASFSLSWSNLLIPISGTRVKLEQLSNTDLVIRCQEGRQPDKMAFTELLRRYQSHVDRILYHLAPDWNDRPDLAQEVWIKVYKKISHLQDPRKFRSWLTTITTRLFYDQLRKRKKYKGNISLDAFLTIDDDEMNWELPSNDPSPEDNLSTAEFYEQLQKAIIDLPETFRTTIVLREIEGMSYDEIAEITGVSLGTVKSRIARARLKLQSMLQSHIQ